MRKADTQKTFKKGADEAAAPPSPIIPTKRSKTSPEQVVPEQWGPGYLNPSPPVFARKMRNAAVGTGCDIRLKVTVAGDPQPSLYWYHNDELLNMENQEYGGLWIRDCKPSDAGLYTCIANNHLGEARTSAVLAVLDLGEGKYTDILKILLYFYLQKDYNFCLKSDATKHCSLKHLMVWVMGLTLTLTSWYLKLVSKFRPNK